MSARNFGNRLGGVRSIGFKIEKSGEAFEITRPLRPRFRTEQTCPQFLECDSPFDGILTRDCPLESLGDIPKLIDRVAASLESRGRGEANGR
jgi:hypothetical protein